VGFLKSTGHRRSSPIFLRSSHVARLQIESPGADARLRVEPKSESPRRLAAERRDVILNRVDFSCRFINSRSDRGNLAAPDIGDKAAIVMTDTLQLDAGYPDSSGRVSADESDPT
jgi:hypothetical protein